MNRQNFIVVTTLSVFIWINWDYGFQIHYKLWYFDNDKVIFMISAQILNVTNSIS